MLRVSVAIFLSCIIASVDIKQLDRLTANLVVNTNLGTTYTEINGTPTVYVPLFQGLKNQPPYWYVSIISVCTFQHLWVAIAVLLFQPKIRYLLELFVATILVILLNLCRFWLWFTLMRLDFPQYVHGVLVWLFFILGTFICILYLQSSPAAKIRYISNLALKCVNNLNALRNCLEQMWKLRYCCNENWCILLNYLQSALKFETNLTSNQINSVVAAIKILQSENISANNVDRIADQLEESGLDIFGSFVFTEEE